ncbi:hypothetical protein [Kitasatospora sp. MY 5-36]|uniref:hypothetical protein n=1 Tax=Kitasatospora sp. MY 5-36 TaxID=1678027 RepID=UPI00131D288C|nr:hypothetical protein [Kitasatospora sp. MY 5-36]
MKIVVSADRVAELLKKFRCNNQMENMERLTAVLSIDSEGFIGVTFPPARELLDIYSYRYSVDEIRESYGGWDKFLSVLDGRDSPIGIAPVKVGDLAAIVLFDEEVKEVLAVLISTAI